MRNRREPETDVQVTLLNNEMQEEPSKVKFPTLLQFPSSAPRWLRGVTRFLSAQHRPLQCNKLVVIGWCCSCSAELYDSSGGGGMAGK